MKKIIIAFLAGLVFLMGSNYKDTVKVEKVTFKSDGLKLVGNLYYPQGSKKIKNILPSLFQEVGRL